MAPLSLMFFSTLTHTSGSQGVVLHKLKQLKDRFSPWADPNQVKL